MSKVKSDIRIKDLKWLIIIILITLVLLVIYLKEYAINAKIENEAIINTKSETQQTGQQENQTTQVEIQRTDEDIIKYLSGLDERSRMEYYCGEYLKHIKYKEYEEAYKLLYSEFKENYFPTLEEYEEYVKEYYPKFFAVQYDDIDRQGDIYIIRLKIVDATNSSKNGNNAENNEDNIQRIVIRENGFNDFVMSFQVNKSEENKVDNSTDANNIENNN